MERGRGTVRFGAAIKALLTDVMLAKGRSTLVLLVHILLLEMAAFYVDEGPDLDGW
jgi:hypothetical protein